MESFVEFGFGHCYKCRTAVRTIIWVVQGEHFVQQDIDLFDCHCVVSLYRCLAGHRSYPGSYRIGSLAAFHIHQVGNYLSYQLRRLITVQIKRDPRCTISWKANNQERGPNKPITLVRNGLRDNDPVSISYSRWIRRPRVVYRRRGVEWPMVRRLA